MQWSRYLLVDYIVQQCARYLRTSCVSVSVSVLILAMIQDQALVSSKHFLVETEDKNLVDNAVDPSIGDSHAVCMTVDEMV